MKTLIMAAVALVGSGLIANAQATPVTWDFTVTATNGPLVGVSSTGTFTYDTSIIPPGGGSVGATNLLTSLHFVWDGFTYNQTTANTGSLGFDSTGALLSFDFGTNCTAGGCGVTSGMEQWEVGGTVFTVTGGFAYALANTPLGQFEGNIKLTQVIPEPASLAMLGVGVIGLGLIRRRLS